MLRAEDRCDSAKKKRRPEALKNLYVREDHALTAIARQLAERYRLDRAEGLEFLRAHRLVITCGSERSEITSVNSLWTEVT